MRRRMPWWLVAGVVVLVLFILVGLFVWRGRTTAPGGGEPPTAPGEVRGY